MKVDGYLMKIAIAALLTATLIVSSESWAQGPLASPIHGVSCEALMLLKESSAAPFEDAQGSLMFLHADLKRRLEMKDADILPSYRDFILRTESFDEAPPRASQLKKATRRLDAILSDSQKPGFDGSYVAFEVRGKKDIQNAMNRLAPILGEIQSVLEGTEKTDTQKMNIQRAVDIGLALLVGATVADPLFNEATTAAVTDAVAAGLATTGYVATSGPVKRDIFYDSSFMRQMYEMEQTLASDTWTSDKIWAYGTSAKIHTDYHQEIMSCASPKDLAQPETRQEACQDAWLGWVDSLFLRLKRLKEHGGLQSQKMSEEVRYPAGKWRQMYLDQFFFVDPQDGQPVWIVVYRTFKNKPNPPKKGKPKEQERKWDWGVDGGFEPAG